MNYHGHSRRLIALLATLLVAFDGRLSGQDAEEDLETNYLNLRMVVVVTASKTAELAWEAPGVITTVTADEIQAIGGTSLYEILERVPGLQVFHTAVNPKNLVTIRGDANPEGNHVLLLVDGRPFRESWLATISYHLYASLPVCMIERIEIVRGPGSVLYGSNAFTGVINVITKKPKESTTEFMAGTGSYGATQGELFTSYRSNDFYASLGLKFFDEEGWRLKDYDIHHEWIERDQYEDNLGLWAEASFKGLKLNVQHAKTKQANWGTAVQADNATFWQVDRTNISLQWDQKINDYWVLNASAAHAQTEHLTPLFTDVNFEPYSEEDIYEVTLLGSIGEKMNIVFGAVNNRMKGNSDFGIYQTATQPWDFDWKSAYSQFDYKPVSNIKLIIGAQYNEIKNIFKGEILAENRESSSDSWSPRFGAVVNFNENIGLKVLYGEAFKSPNAANSAIFFGDVIKGNANLKPETIATTDIQLFYNKDRFQVSGTFYHSRQEDLIFRVSSPGSPTTWVNVGTLKMQGMEFESKYVPSAQWYLLGALTYQTNENGEGIEDFSLAPNLSAKVGFYFDNHKWSFGLFDSYFGAFKDNILTSPTRLDYNPHSKAVHRVAGKASFQLKSNNQKISWRIEIEANNLLDEAFHVPEVQDQQINTIMSDEGSAYYANIRANF